MLATSAALTACGDTSDSSNSSSNSSTSKPEAWELEDAAVSYVVDKNGVETANYTVKGKNGKEYTKSVATGRTVVEIYGESVKVNGEQIEASVIETSVGNEPKIEVLAMFNDDTAGWVTITDDMYVGAKPDYTKAGLYTMNIKLVERLSAPVLVKGDEPVVVQSMLLNEQMGGMCVLWDKADVVAATYDVSTVFWGYYTYDGENENQVVVNAKADQIKPIDWTAESEEGIYNFSVTNENGESGVLQAYVMDEDSETTITVEERQLDSMTMTGQLTALKGSQVSAIDTSDMKIMEMIMVGTDAMAMRMVDVPETVEYTLDTTECGDKELVATWTEGEEPITAKTSVLVYENKEECADVANVYVNSYKVVESGVLDMLFEVYSYTEYTSGTGEVLMGTGYNTETVALTADMIKGTAPDFTTAGVKVFTVEIGGNEYTYAVELWAEAEKPVATTTNIDSLNLPEEITILKDQNIELYVRQNFVNQAVQVQYIEAVNGSYEDEVVLKASAFDWSAVKTNVVGEYALKVSYEGYEKTITVNVVEEISEEESVPVAQLLAEMGALYPNDCFAIILYSDNTAEIMEENPMYGGNIWYGTYEIDAQTDTMMLSWSVYGFEQFAITTVLDSDEDGVYDYVRAYEFGEPTAIYAFVDRWENSVELKLYEEGIAELWDVNNMYTIQKGVYTFEDGLLTLGEYKFYIQGTGADAKVIEVMSGEY